jgi:hypothetical protein
VLVSTQPKEEKKRIKNMLEGGSVRLKPEKRQEMEERVNILTSFIRSMLNDRDAWKKHDAVGKSATPRADAVPLTSRPPIAV